MLPLTKAVLEFASSTPPKKKIPQVALMIVSSVDSLFAGKETEMLHTHTHTAKKYSFDKNVNIAQICLAGCGHLWVTDGPFLHFLFQG